MENDRYTETQKRKKKKDVICEAIFKGTLRLGVQDVKPWCKVKIKMRLEVSLRSQSRCSDDVLNASQKLWVAEWTFPPLLPAQHLSRNPLPLLSGFLRFPGGQRNLRITALHPLPCSVD